MKEQVWRTKQTRKREPKKGTGTKKEERGSREKWKKPKKNEPAEVPMQQLLHQAFWVAKTTWLPLMLLGCQACAQSRLVKITVNICECMDIASKPTQAG